MLQESEFLNVILGVVSLVTIVATIGMSKSCPIRCFVFATAALLGSYICTNLEAFFLPTLLNLLEHLLFLVAAVFFLILALRIRKDAGGTADD